MSTGAGAGRLAVLVRLARVELFAGLAGLKLFMAAVALGSAMLALVWLLATGVGDAFDRNGRQILGGDVEMMAATALEPEVLDRLAELGRLSTAVDMRSSVRLGEFRAPVELRAVDSAYPLYGQVRVSDGDLDSLLARTDAGFGAVAEATLLDRLDADVGDTVTIGDITVQIRATLIAEPDRLGVGAFMVGPRLLISTEALDAAGLLAPGALVDFRYRLARFVGQGLNLTGIAALEPDTGWRLRTPHQVAERVRRAVDRTTTFMGIAGVAAMAVGMAGAWTAAGAWVRKRARTIALYRLSGADRLTVAALHGTILGVAAVVATVIGVIIALVPTVAIFDLLQSTLPIDMTPGLLATTGLFAAAVMLLGVCGAAVPAIAAAARVPAGAAMRSGEPPIGHARFSVLVGAVLMVGAMALSIAFLPDQRIGSIAAGGLIVGALALGLIGRLLAMVAGWIKPRGFVAMVALRALSDPRAAAAKAVAIGIGIAAITAVDLVSKAFDAGLASELPRRLPELVLIDVQPDQREELDRILDETDGVYSVQLQPNLRANIRTVNGERARDMLVDMSEAWVLRGDRGISWSAEPVPGYLMAGRWWPADYDGPMLLSISDDVAEAFAIGPGDELGIAVLGRVMTGEVANVRNVRWQAIGANFIMVASPNPLRFAPHNWIATIEGSDPAIDGIIRQVSRNFENVTAIDVRTLLDQLANLVGGASDGALAVALALLIAGGIALAAVIAADADARTREGLAFSLVGASRVRIAAARLAEVAAIGLLAAILGGGAGIVGGQWLAEEALRVEGIVTVQTLVLPLAIGLLAALTAGLVSGIASMPRGRGGLIAQLAG